MLTNNSNGCLPFNIRKGASFKKFLLWKDSLGKPISLTNYLGRLAIRDVYANLLLELFTNDDTDKYINFEPNSEVGRIIIFIGATLTESLTWTSGIYDFEIYNPNDLNDVVNLLRGKVSVLSEITT